MNIRLHTKPGHKTRTVTMMTAALLALVGCAQTAPNSSNTSVTSSDTLVSEIRLGYFANITHAPALIGTEEGFFKKSLGSTKLSTQVFNAGPAAIEALTAGAIDAAYVGPSPAITTYIQSAGASVKIIAGATHGGASLVVSAAIKTAADLRGKTIATPQLGNTQDVAARTWLAGQGLKTNISGGGDVRITPTENAQAFTLFQSGKIDGAWAPEPWASRLIIDGGGHVLVDEASLWPGGTFPTTVLLVNKDFLSNHPSAVSQLIEGHVLAVNWLNDNPEKAANAINKQLKAATGKALTESVITQALRNVHFSVDPAAATFTTLVKNGITAGTQKKGSIEGLFDLRPLNAVLKKNGATATSAGGLGDE